MRYESGHVVEVSSSLLGDQLAAAAPVGATVLLVEDPVDFSETGGTLTIGTQVINYSSMDDEAGTLLLETPTTVAYDVAERVRVHPPSVVKEALVILDGADEAVTVRVPHSLHDRLADGTRDISEYESVALELDGWEWVLVDILGEEPEIAGDMVWNPHSFRDMNAVTIPHDTWVTIGSWTNMESDGITIAAGYTVVYPGWYFTGSQAAFMTNATGRRRIRLLKNGDTVNPVAFFATNADPSGWSFVPCSAELRLAEGDVITVQVSQTSGADLALVTGPGRSNFSMHRISI